MTSVILVGLYVYIAHHKSFWPFMNNNSSNSDLIIDGINYSPPTQQEEESSQYAKDNLLQQPASSADNGGTSNRNTKNVSVGVAYAAYDKSKGAVDIRAFIPDVIEGSGVCTATLYLDGMTVTGESKAFIDSSSSQCEPILIKKTGFATTGTWSLVVSYLSPTSEGKSPAMEVEVTNE